MKFGCKTANAKWIFDRGTIRCLGSVTFNLETLPEELWSRTDGHYIVPIEFKNKWYEFWKPNFGFKVEPLWWWNVEFKQALNLFNKAMTETQLNGEGE